MTSRIDGWQGNSFPLATWVDDHDPGVDTAILIADKSTSIVVVRGGAEQAAQTVRIEEARGNRQVITSAGVVHQIDAVIIGYAGHPSIADTSLQPGDRFALAGVRYEIIMLAVGLADGLHAYAKVVA